MSNSPKNIKGVIDRFEQNYAIIRLKDGQELRWSIEELPDNIHEGAVVYLILAGSESSEKEQEQLAKTMLNEILKE